MPLTLTERLRPVHPERRPGRCEWCFSALTDGEGVDLDDTDGRHRDRFCNEACAEAFEADRIARSPKARAEADRPVTVCPVSAEVMQALRALVPAPTPTRAEVER